LIAGGRRIDIARTRVGVVEAVIYPAGRREAAA